jgi:Anti-sigma factor NepR
MAARDSDEKPGQVSDMNARQTTEAVPIAGKAGQADSVVGAAFGADLQAHIGRQLRAVYDEVVEEAVPERFLRLLEELERKQAPRS